MIKPIPVKPSSYAYTTCTCGRRLMIWPGETVHHVPRLPECSEYVGVVKNEAVQAGFDFGETQ